ncbi:MAG: Uma2 family endonuclease [Planctomycetes bacterium]|nr:Uma2 family endonuclease [Planctomycetota bacterium]
MSATLEQPAIQPAAEVPRPHRWSAEELYHLLQIGFFAGRRIELIDGEIIDMAAQGNLHAQGISLTEEALRTAFGPKFWVRVQMSIDLTPYSVPDPDLAVIPGSVRDNAGSDNPKSALLIVEVSDTTLSYDRNRKGSLYARVGIADYWIVNVEKKWLEVHRNPIPDESKDFQFRYQDVVYLEPSDAVSPLALPNAKIKVADLLP